MTKDAPIDTFKMLFHTYDVNKNGRLEPEEIKSLLKVSTTSLFA